MTLIPGSPANTFGVMQGRLSPPEDGRFQSFPRANWRQEFGRAKEAGLDHIEWIHDAYGEGKDASGRVWNPIFSEAGLAEMDALKQEHGIATPALCADWFMDVPLIMPLVGSNFRPFGKNGLIK